MDEEETKACENCNRDIPAANYTPHALHCARNLRLCPVCKEPVPASELTNHHDTLHKPLPCNQCGESVCGTDLEDHVRDSCGHTIKSCRFCELELPRRDLPAHEAYCGTRTEQCADCGEWVMLRYRTLHLQSNHGFIRLDDDPIPQQAQPAKATNIPKPTNVPKSTNLPEARDGPKTEIRYFNRPNEPTTSNVKNAKNQANLVSNSSVPKNYNQASSVPKNVNNQGSSNTVSHPYNASASVSQPYNAPSASNGSASASNLYNPSDTKPTKNSSRPTSSTSAMPTETVVQNVYPSCSNVPTVVQNAINGGSKIAKRTNDQPQVNTSVAAASKVNKETPPPRGAVKKRPAPPPPAPREPQQRDPVREAALCSALNRFYDEQARREQQNQYNLAHGLPPVLSAAEKLEKLRKMDALQNREREDDSWRQRLRGRVWVDRSQPSGHVLGSEPGQGGPELHASRRRDHCCVQPRNRRGGANCCIPSRNGRNEFKDLKPMSPEEFAARFRRLQVAEGEGQDEGEDEARGGEGEGGARGGDRFSEIKSSLHALRRGLNEVTAPYLGNPIPNPITNNNNNYDNFRPPSPNDADDDVRLPCEFCGRPVPAPDLVLHQTGCRPDLVQKRPRRRPQVAALPPPPPPDPYEDPVIPCEFCTESLPVYLITEHQERCRRRGNEVYSD